MSVAPSALPQTDSPATTWSAVLTELHSVKAAARVATTGNITLAGGTPDSVDGKALSVGDRVLVMNQTNPAQNGIYVVQTVGGGADGTWVRASDSDMWVKMVGAALHVFEGNTHGGTQWRSTATLGGTLGSTSLTYTKVTGKAVEGLANLAVNGILVKDASDNITARSLTAGNGITITNGDGISADPAIGIATDYAGQGSITTLGTITSGTWNAGTIAAVRGGTGLTGYATGDILYASGANTLAARSIGNTGEVLTVSGGVPTWNSISNTLGYVPANAAGNSFSGAIGMVPGAAATPGLYVNGSTSTGLYSPAANQISIAASGSEVLRLVSSGADIRSGGLAVGGVTVLDASRNLANVAALSATGNASIGGTLGVTGAASFNAPVTVTGNGGAVLQSWNYLSGTATRSMQLIAPSGSVDSPYVFFTNNAFRFQVDDISALRIDSAGNTLVDTKISFGSRLGQIIDLYGTGYAIGIQGSTHYFRSGADYQFYIGGSHSDTRGVAGAGGFSALTIKDTGNIGIGSTAPAQKLDVNGAIAVSGTTVIDASRNVTGTTFNKLSLTQPANGATLTIADGKTFAVNRSLTLSGTDGTTMTFPASSATLARIDAAQTFSGVQTFSNAPVISALSASLPVFTDANKGLVSNSMTGTGSVVMSASPTLTGTVSGAAAIWSGDVTAARFTPTGGSAPTNGMFLPSANALGFATNGTARMVIDSSGNVGVGTTAANARLHVVQSASTKPAIILAGSGDNANGMVLSTWFNANGNRQLWIGDSTKALSSTQSFFRLGGGGGNIAYIDAVRGDGGAQMPITLGTLHSNVAIGGSDSLAYNATLPGKLAVYPASATQVGLAIRNWSGQSANMFEVQNSAGTALLTIGNGGALATSSTVTASSFTGLLTGNASTATTLQNARNFSITGDGTAPTVSFNGSGDVALNLTLANTGVSAGMWGSATQAPQFVVDAKGRITSATQVTVTPAWSSITSVPANVSALSGVTGAAGALPYFTGAGTMGTLGVGAANTVLTSTGSAPQWTASTGTGNVVMSASPTLTGTVSGAAATWSGDITAARITPTSSTAPTNGLYLPAANTLGFATSSTQAMVINSAGSVGIGVSNPAVALQVNGDIRLGAAQPGNDENRGVSIATGAQLSIVANDSGADGNFTGLNLRAGASSNLGYVEIGPSSAPNAIRFGTTNTERMRIDSAGNIGIGITNPSARLHVAGDIQLTSVGTSISSAGSELILQQTGDTGGQTRFRLQSRFGSNGALVENPSLEVVDLGFKTSAGPQGSLRLEQRSDQRLNANNTSGELQWVDDSTSSPTRVISIGKSATILNVGNLGVGTQVPGYKLDVNGTANFSGNTTVGGSLSGAAASFTGLLGANGGVAVGGSTVIDANRNFSGNGASLTNLTAANLTGTIPSAVLGASTLYVGTTAIALDRASAVQALTGITSIDGSAATLTTARNFSISGDGTASAVSFNGSGDVALNLTLANAGVAAGTYGSATQVPQFVVDAKGRITSATSITVTPAWSSITGVPANVSALSGVTGTAGALPYFTGAGTMSTLGVGAANTVLTSTGSAPQWTTSTGTGNVVMSASPTLTGTVSGAAATWSGDLTAARIIPTSGTAPTNGLYLPAANTLGFATGSTARMVIDAAGNVGIGSASPAYTLDVSGAARLTGTAMVKGVTTTGTVGLTSADIGTNAVLSRASVSLAADTALFGAMNTNDYFYIGGSPRTDAYTASDDGALYIMSGDGKNEPIIFGQWQNNQNINSARYLTLMDASGNTQLAGTLTSPGQVILTADNNSATGMGKIYLNGDVGNRIDFNDQGVEEPTTSTRIPGTKVIWYPAAFDWSTGIGPGSFWNAINASVMRSFFWYAGTTRIMTITTTGDLTVTGSLYSGSSSASAPAYSFSADTDTGIWSPGANALAVSTGGVQRMVVDASGNVGIGSASPTQRLDVNGAIAVSGTVVIDANRNFSGNGASLTNLTAANLTGTIPSAVLGASTLYVGTTAIALDRASAVQALTGITSIDGSAATLTTARNFSISGDGTASAVSFNGSGDVALNLTLANAGVAAGTYGSATQVPQFVVDAKGRITSATSITVTPAWSSITGVPANVSALSGVTGTAGALPYFTGAGTMSTLGVGAANTVLTSTGSAPQWTASTGTGNVVMSASPTLTGTVSGAAATWSGDITAARIIPTSSTAPTNGLYLPAANTLGFATNATPRLVVDALGRVGVGSASPSYTLDVQGDLRATGTLYATSGAVEFSGTARQMINLSGTGYGIGVQDSTTYLRSAGDFQFYLGGTHSGTQGDAGSGGISALTVKNTGNVGIGITNPATKLDVAGDIRASNIRTLGLTRTLPVTVGNAVDLGSFGFSNGAGALWISVTVPAGSFSVTKQYVIPVGDGLTGDWGVVQPLAETGNYGGNDYELDARSLSFNLSLRLRRTGGTTAGTAHITIHQEGLATNDFTGSTATATVTAPTAFYGPAVLRQLGGNAGIGSASPAQKLDVNGAIAIGGTTVIDGSRNVTAGVVTGSSFVPGGTTVPTNGMFYPATNMLAFATSSTAVVRFNSAGNVGIGTTNPYSRLQIGVPFNANNVFGQYAMSVVHPTPVSTSVLNDPKPVLYLARTGTSGQSYGAGAVFGISRWTNSSSDSRARLDIQLAHGGWSQATSQTSLASVMTIRSDGNIGIGRTTPAQKLDVDSAIAVGGATVVDSSSNFSAATLNVAGPAYTVQTAGGDVTPNIAVTGNMVSILKWGGGEARYHLHNGGDTAEWLMGQKSNTQSNFTLSTLSNGVEQDHLVFWFGGRIGVGRASPSQMLDVGGAIAVSGTTLVNASRNITATSLSGTGASITALTAANLTGAVAAPVLGNSTLRVGTTAITLNRASASQVLTGITSIDGSAATLTTARNFSISGDGTASAGSFNGSGDVALNLTLANTGVAAGTYGSQTQVPQFVVDAKGRITSATQVTLTPAWSSITSVPANVSAFGGVTGTAGALPYFTGAGTMNRLAAGAANTVLTSTGSAPQWTASTGTGNVVMSASPTLTGTVSGAAATWSGDLTAARIIPTSSTAPTDGFYLPAANTLGFATSSTERMRLDSQGNLAIGSTGGDYGTPWRMIAREDKNGLTRIGVINAATGASTQARWSTITGTGFSYFESALSDGGGSPFVQIFSGGTISGLTQMAARHIFQNTAGTELMRIESSGNVGIGNVLGAKLHVAGAIAVGGTTVIGANQNVYATTGSASLPGYSFSGDTNTGMYAPSADTLAFSTSGTLAMQITATGDVGIGTAPSYKLHVNGTAMGTAWNTTSDRRYKQNILPLANALSVIDGLEGVSYDFRANEFPSIKFPSGRQIGVIAQQVEPLVPEVVTTTADGYKSVNYTGFVPLLIEGVKELNRKVVEQGKLVVAQGDKIKTIEEWIGKADPRLKSLEDFMGKAQTRLAKVEDFAAKAEPRVKALEDWKAATDTRLASADDMLKALSATSSAHGALLAHFNKTDDRIRVDVPNFQVSNFSAELAEIAEIRAKKLEAETARIKQIEAEKIKTKELESQQVKSARMFSGEKDLWVTMGDSVPVFEVPAGARFVVNASSEDGSYATARVVHAGGVVNVTQTGGKGLDLVAKGNSVALVAAGKQVSVSWVRMK